MSVTLKQIAALAGVSISAASRTFTEGASVSQKTRRRVERAAQQLGYRPNYLAKGLLKQQTKLIGLVSDSLDNPAFFRIFDLFSQDLQRRGYRPLLINLEGGLTAEHAVSMLQQYSADAAIVISPSLPEDFGEVFLQAGMPVVQAFGQCTGQPKVNSVGVDNSKCGSMAAEFLISRGYVNIGFVGGIENDPCMHERLEGFLTTINRYPRVRFSYSFAGAITHEAGLTEMKRLLMLDRAEVYFCADDVLAIAALNAIADEGLSVPGDIGVLGINDTPAAAWSLVNLSTLHLPASDIVASSVDLALDSIPSEARSAEARLFPCAVVERGSTRP